MRASMIRSLLIGRSKEKIIVLTIAAAACLSLWYDTGMINSLQNSRKLSLHLGNGTCQWVAAIQHSDEGFPKDTNFKKTLISGYPGGDKRLTFVQMEGLTGLSARDEWEFNFFGMTNQPFIKANYPHHEGIWGWQDQADQVLLVVSDLKRSLVEYHDILWDIGYAQTFAEAFERIEMLYKDEADGVPHENPPVEDFLVWRDLRVFDEIHWYSWFMDYYMENGLMRDMFNHKLTVEDQWKMAMAPNYFTKYEMRFGRFVDDNETVPESYDPMCDTLAHGCYPVLVIDPEKLVHPDPSVGPVEAKKIAQLINGTEGFEDWMIDEEAWECVWEELIVHKKGIKTFRDRADTLPYDSYIFSFEMKNEIWNELNRLIVKYGVKTDQVAIDLVEILTRHRDELDIVPADPMSYEELLGYHLAFPPFFPNQKPFQSEDDFFVKQHEKYENPDRFNVESIIERRRIWFEEEMEKKRERKVDVGFYDATGWTSLPPGGLASLTPYKTRQVSRIKYGESYQQTKGRFKRHSDRDNNVAALFTGHLYIDPLMTHICVTSADGSKLYIDGVLAIDHDGVRSTPTRKCTTISEGVFQIDLEYFLVNGRSAELVLQFGPSLSRMRSVPARSWASADGQRRYRELMRLNDLLEQDLEILTETDFMGPTTRAEFNRRKKLTDDPSEVRKLDRDAFDLSNFDDIRKLKKSDQLKIARSMFAT